MGHTGVFLIGMATFVQNVLGIITRPYETSRRIAANTRLAELPFLAFFLFLYFALASIVKTSAFRPYLMTKQFIVLCSGAGLLYIVTVVVLWKASLLLGGTGGLKQLAVSWAYTLIPTSVWFLSTSLLYVILPPPRTTSAEGIVFSILYLVFSITLLFWKIILSYLAVRFSMKLDLVRILGASALTSPFVIGVSMFLYMRGVFKVPFI